MNKLEIRAGIPLPPVKGRPSPRPFREMKVGESFVSGTPVVTTRWQKLTGFKFATRRVTEHGSEAWRVWRVE